MEQVLAEIEGVKHVYSVSRPGMSVLTVQFKVGEERTESLVRLYNAIYSNQDWRPANLGIGAPMVKPKGIDDVPIVAVTLWTEDPERGAHELLKVAHALEAEIKRVPGTRDVYTIGGAQDIVHVELDPERVSGFGMTLDDLRLTLNAGNDVRAGRLLVSNGRGNTGAGGYIPVRAQKTSPNWSSGVFDGRPVFLSDIADVNHGATSRNRTPGLPAVRPLMKSATSRWHTRRRSQSPLPKSRAPTPRRIADAVIERFAQLR